ncbi:MAG TPA: diacylglycerol kinase family protein [Chroococcales cyanobacterium]
MPRHALVVYNPAAGTASDADLWLGTIVHHLCGKYAVTVLATRAEMSPDLIFGTISDPLDLVVAVGGDGTLRYVLGAVAAKRSNIPVGIVPMGTGNQLARNLGIYEENILIDPLEEAVKVILTGTPIEMDLGIMNGQYFCVAAGAGPLSDAILLPESKDKVNWKMLAYASSMIQTFALPPVVFNVKVEEESFQVAASGVFVCNIADLGVGKLSHTAEINDGLLDLCILNPNEFEDYIRMGFSFAGGFVGGEAPYYIRKVKSVDIEVVPVRSKLSKLQTLGRKVRSIFQGGMQARPPLKRDVTAMVDGDAYGTTPMHIEVAPHAVHVLAPASFAASLGSYSIDSLV